MEDQVAEVKSKVDIVGLIGARVELKRAGKNMRGLCPFHAERTPSFFVSPEMQSFKCFGCGESGDCFSFLEKYEGLSFREALEELAERVGVKLTRYAPSAAENESKRLYEVLHLAGEYYQYLLQSHKAGARARDYLEGRGVNMAVAREFNLGWAPTSWDSLYKYLVVKKKYPRELVEKAGLIVKSNKVTRQQSNNLGGRARYQSNEARYYDRFRGRIVFALTDFRGRMVGFSGRLLEEKEADSTGSTGSPQAKYVNTPETLVYHKRELLFGLDQAKGMIRKKGKAILVEGEFDVISSWRAGVRNAVGIKGSAVTAEQLKLLIKLTREVVLCLDADSAGDAAMRRGIEEADKMGVDVSVVSVTGGKDPDEVVRHDPKVWKELVAKPKSVYEFLVESAFAKHDGGSGTGKKKITEELVPVLNKISNSVERAHYVRVIAAKLGVGEEALAREMERAGREEKVSPRREERGGEEAKVDRQTVLERYLWGVLLSLSGEWFVRGWKEVGRVEEMSPSFERLRGKMEEFLKVNSGEFELTRFGAGLPHELANLVGEVYLSEKVMAMESGEEACRELGKVAEELSRLVVGKKLALVAVKIGKGEGDQTKLDRLQREYARLTGKLAV